MFLRDGAGRMSKLTKSARNQECTVRVTGICSFDRSTTVLAHLNGGGMGMKALDIHGAFACHTCHKWLDSGWVKTHSRMDRDLYHLQGMVRTQTIWVNEGLIKYD